MATHNIKRKLVAILAADAVGFSRLMGAKEEQTMRVLNAHRAVIDGIIEYHEGRIVGTAGDSVLAEFGSPTDAVRCAVEIQDALKTRNNSLPEIDRMHFRIGVNLGDVMIKDDDLLGDGVNIAARLESIAEPGGICISSSVYDQIAGKLDLGFVEIGEQHLKNIERPIRVYRVATGVARPAPAPSAPTRKVPSRWLYAAGVATIVLAAVAVVPQLRDSTPVPAVSLPASSSDAQRALESQRNAEEKSRAETAIAKARADAEIAAAKMRLDAEVAKVRAEANLAAARAESQVAKLRAEADAAAARAKQQEPPASKASTSVPTPAPTATAPAPAAAAPAQVATAAPAAAVIDRAPAATAVPEGPWVADRLCEPIQERGALNDQPGVAVSDGEFVVEKGQAGQPGYMAVRGKPGADGKLLLDGYRIATADRIRGLKARLVFEGRLEGERYLLKGKMGTRACTLTISRR